MRPGLGRDSLAAWALRDLGQQRVRQASRRESAKALLVEGLALARATGDQRGAGAALMILAEAAGLAGDAERARALQAESLAAARRVGDRWLLSSILLQVGGAAVDAADFRAALPLLEEGLAVTRGRLRMPSREGEYQWQLGRVALAQGARRGPSPCWRPCGRRPWRGTRPGGWRRPRPTWGGRPTPGASRRRRPRS